MIEFELFNENIEEIDIEDKLIDLDENDLLHLILELIKKYTQIKKFIVKW